MLFFFKDERKISFIRKKAAKVYSEIDERNTIVVKHDKLKTKYTKIQTLMNCYF